MALFSTMQWSKTPSWFNASLIKFLNVFTRFLVWVWVCLPVEHNYLIWSIIKPRKRDETQKGRKGFLFWQFFSLTVSYLCQVEGHGGTLSKFSLKSLKNFLRQIWKIFCVWYHYGPLFQMHYEFWTVTSWFRLCHFWTTVKWQNNSFLLLSVCKFFRCRQHKHQ